MAYYDRQNFSEQALALHFANLFGEDNQVQTLHFAQGEDAAGSWQARFRRPLQWVLDRAPDATPGVWGSGPAGAGPGSQWPSTKTIFSTNSSATTTTHGLISRQRPVPSFITQ